MWTTNIANISYENKSALIIDSIITGSTYKHHKSRREGHLPATSMNHSSRHSALLAEEAVCSHQRHTQRRGLEDTCNRLAEDKVPKDRTRRWSMLKAVQLSYQDTEHRERQ